MSKNRHKTNKKGHKVTTKKHKTIKKRLETTTKTKNDKKNHTHTQNNWDETFCPCLFVSRVSEQTWASQRHQWIQCRPSCHLPFLPLPLQYHSLFLPLQLLVLLTFTFSSLRQQIRWADSMQGVCSSTSLWWRDHSNTDSEAPWLDKRW